MKGVWFEWTSLTGNTQHGSGHFVANNIFYQCQAAIATAIYDDWDEQPNWIKYNIFYGGGQSDYSQIHYQFSNDTNFISDSNLYFNLPTNHIYRNGTTMSLATWQTYRSGNWAGAVRHDLHSKTYNPGFANAATYDFRRLASSQELNVTYGGKTWTRYGVWQAPLCTGCIGSRGNIDGSPNDAVDIGDLTALLAFLFGPGSAGSICVDEANCDGSTNGVIDVADLTLLIQYLFYNQSGSVRLAPCP